MSIVQNQQYFIIDATPLMSASKKPYHLESRIQSKKNNDLSFRLSKKTAQRSAYVEAKKQKAAQHIRKAKAIAMGHIHRSKQASETKRLAIDQKLKESESRRRSLLFVPRSKLLDVEFMQDLEFNLKRDDSARVIQTWWRCKKCNRFAQAYKKFNLSMTRAKELTFPQLVKKLQSDALINTVGRLLVRAKRMSLEPVENWKAPSKTFLSSYLISAHTKEIMPRFDPEEETLKDLAESMLVDFEAWLGGSNGIFVLGLGRKFLSSWIAFYNAFSNWKSVDTNKLIKDVIKHFMDMESLWLSVRHEEVAETEWLPQIKIQQKETITRLSKLNPEALSQLYETRKKAFDEHMEKNPQDGTRPVTMTNLSIDVYKFADNSSIRDSVSNARSSSVSEPSNRMDENKTPSILPQVNQLTNQKLAHELIMDPEFKLKKEDDNSMEAQVSLIAKKAFFDGVREDFSKGIFKNYVPGLLNDIKEKLIEMLPEKSKVRIEIHEVLDEQLIRQQLENNTFDIPGCLKYIAGKMLQLCAPYRDASIRSLESENDLTSAFNKIFEILEEMKYDLMNYQLQSIKPILSQQAVEYERAKFDEGVQKGEITLDKTTEWLKTSVMEIKAVSAARNPEGIDRPELRVRYENAYNDAFLGLVFSNKPIDVSSLAETLHLDGDRLVSFQNEGQALTIVAVLSMLCNNIVPFLRNHTSANLKLKATLLELLEAQGTTVDSMADRIVSDINDIFSSAGKSSKLTEEQHTTIRNMIDKTLSFTDPVYSLVSRRMQASIRYVLEKEGAFRKESLSSQGLDIVSSELESLSKKLYLLAKHNKDVYVKYYDSILKQLLN